jgi:hypothetical protein
MRLRLVGTLVTLAALCWSSGCCWHRHHCCRHPLREHLSCGCEVEAYSVAPPSGCGCSSSMAPPIAGPLMPIPQTMSGPVYNMPPR